MTDESHHQASIVAKSSFVCRAGAEWFSVTLIAAICLLWLGYWTGDFKSLWLSPDQQGRLAYERRHYAHAEAVFEHAMWKGLAAYANGDYLNAADAFGHVTTAQAFFNRGNAYMKGREYAKAIVAYEQALADAPEWREARENLELARHVLEYVERTREQGDTGDETELGADDLTFDNIRKKGKSIIITDASKLEQQSTELWMRSVDTHAREFLRIRFALEQGREPAR